MMLLLVATTAAQRLGSSYAANDAVDAEHDATPRRSVPYPRYSDATALDEAVPMAMLAESELCRRLMAMPEHRRSSEHRRRLMAECGGGGGTYATYATYAGPVQADGAGARVRLRGKAPRTPAVPLDWIDAELAKGGAVASTDLSETTAANDQFAPTLPLVAPGRRLGGAVCFGLGAAYTDCGSTGGNDSRCGSTDTFGVVKNGGERAKGICSVGTENRRRRTKSSPDHRKWGTGRAGDGGRRRRRTPIPALANMFKVDQGDADDGGCEVRLSDHQDDQGNDRTCHSFCRGYNRSCTRAHDVDKLKKNVRAAALLPPSCHANPTAHLAFPRPPPPRCATQPTAAKRIAWARAARAALTQKREVVTMRGAMGRTERSCARAGPPQSTERPIRASASRAATRRAPGLRRHGGRPTASRNLSRAARCSSTAARKAVAPSATIRAVSACARVPTRRSRMTMPG